MTSADKPFVVIGGGISGMAAALVLAKFGFSVVLIEKRKQLAPTIRGFSRQGTNFDTGLHYVGGLQPDGPLTRYFSFLGLSDVPFTNLCQNCFDRIRFADRAEDIQLPVGRDAIIDYLSGIFPDDRHFISSYYHQIQNLFDSSGFLNFKGNFRDATNAACKQESLACVVDKGTQNPILRTVLSIHSLLYGVSPEETPFIQHARVAGSYLEGVKTVAGGGKILASSFENQLAKSDVTCSCGSAVTAISYDHAGVNGVVLEDERFVPAAGLLFTAHPSILPKLLPDGAIKPAFSRRLLSLEDTISSHTLFCSCDSEIPSVQGNNLFVCLKTGIYHAFRPDCRLDDGPFYVSRRVPDNLVTPMNQSGLIIFAPGNIREYGEWADSKTGQRPEAYRIFKRRRMERLLEIFLRHCPEFKKIRVLDGGTPLTNRDYLGAPLGGLYGTKHSLNQFSPLPATKIPNLWMAGQSIIAPGILGAVISAFVACGFIVGMEKLQAELRKCI
ncbi:MAG: FAD-dependent oxidoreductase [Desulfovibrio sp.]|jgi:all-trans-retinol 13,14-reductase|nr:FAD-dependent oxidoreductase [Desulfovibrio sp.]